MLDFDDFNFDFDGDGNADSFAENVDLDGDGTDETFLISLDSDADGLPDTLIYEQDTDADGYIDSIFVEYDTNGDGIVDAVEYQEDLNGDGYIDRVTTEIDTDNDGVTDEINVVSDVDFDGIQDVIQQYQDLDGDGYLETLVESVDVDEDGIFDMVHTYEDSDADGFSDTFIEESFFDTDGDGLADTYVVKVDQNGDGMFDVLDIHDINEEAFLVEITPLDYSENSDSFTIDDIENFDPAKANPEDIIGDPEDAMEEWEFQGDTNRCALFSQMFVIEDLTDMDIDIEEMADIAEGNGWFTEEGGTPIADMNKMLEYYGVENEMSFDNDIDDIAECLNNGGRVIVSIDADEIWYGELDGEDVYTPYDGVNHAVEVIGIDNSNPDEPMVILNDSGHPDGCGSLIPLDVFMDAWEDGDCQMIACM